MCHSRLCDIVDTGFGKHAFNSRIIKNLPIMIGVFINFGPCVARNIKYFSFVGGWTRSTNRQRSFVNRYQCGEVVSIIWICLIVKKISVIAEWGLIEIVSSKMTNLSQRLFFACEKQSKIRSPGKLYVPQAPYWNS